MKTLPRPLDNQSRSRQADEENAGLESDDSLHDLFLSQRKSPSPGGPAVVMATKPL